MQADIRKSNEFLKNVIRSSVDGIIAADMRGNVIIFNEGAERLLGYTADEVIGRRHITELYPPGVAKDIMAWLRGGDKGPAGKLPTTPTTLIARDGEEIPVNISAAIVHDDGKEAASVGIFTDLRERLRMQRELDETYRQLFRSEKLMALGTLAAGVAHEINNPLNNISTSCQILMEDIAERLEPFQRERLQWIEDHVNKARDIVRALLEFSREQDFSLCRGSLADAVEDTLKLIRGEIQPNVELQVELHEEIVIDYDKTRIEQAVLNILMNAIHAMEETGGILSIRTGLAERERLAFVEVTDTGVGIPARNLPHIFDPFFSTKGVGKGTGLGLSLAFANVERHGGSIRVESEPGRGSTFTIRLPLP